MGKILNEGDYNNNYEVLESKKDNLIPKYRTRNSSVENLVVCAHCKGLYNRYLLYQLNKKCFMRGDTENSQKKQPVRNCKLAMPVPKNVSKSFYEKIILKMKKDDVFRLIQNDSLILLYGEGFSFIRRILRNILTIL